MINIFVPQGISSSAPVDASKWQEAISDAPSQSYPTEGPQPGDATVGVFNPSLLQVGTASESPTRSFDIQESEWLPKHQRRFIDLVRAQALCEITPEQKKELNRLQALRRSLHHPRTPEEIIREHRTRMATQNLIAALQEYVTLFSIAGQTRPGPKEEV